MKDSRPQDTLRVPAPLVDEFLLHADELPGEVPSPIDAPSGCPFRTRCTHAMDVCATTFPAFRDIGADHKVACYLYT